MQSDETNSTIEQNIESTVTNKTEETKNAAPIHTGFIAFINDDRSYDIIREFAEAHNYPAATVQPGGIDALTALVENSKSIPKIILVDIDGKDDPQDSLVRIIEALDGIAKIIAVGSTNDINLFRDLLAAGAADYVVKPLNNALLEKAHQAAINLIKAKAEETFNASKIITLIGVRGGVGTSTLAVNLGWLFAHKMNLTTALLDLDLQYGTSTLSLDLVPGRGLREALQSPGRLDSLLVASSMVNESERFSILGAEEAIEDSINYDSSAVTTIIHELKASFSFVLIDMPRHLIHQQKRLLADSHKIVLVADQTLASVRDIVRIKNVLKNIAPQTEVLVVISRLSVGKGERAPQVDKMSFEENTQSKIIASIPDDHQAMMQAANHGIAISKAAPNAASTQAILTLAEQLTEHQISEQKQAGWAKLVSKFSKNKKDKKDKKNSSSKDIDKNDGH